MKTGSFPLGVVTVEVTTRDGSAHLEDWAQEDADEAREYAAETADCVDVVRVVFLHGAERTVFKGSAQARSPRHEALAILRKTLSGWKRAGAEHRHEALEILKSIN